MDADKVRHRDYFGKVKGKFDLKFLNPEEYEGFVDIVHYGARNEMLELSVYCVNTNEQKEITAFYNYKPTLTKNLPGGKKIGRFSFEFEEQ